MAADEAVLVKCYNSARDGRTRFSLHAAFVDPTVPADAPPRESIEVRTFAFFNVYGANRLRDAVGMTAGSEDGSACTFL